jgi:diaminopimelate decarboxylase
VRPAPGHPVWLRINPGFGHGHSNKTNTGGEHSKHGIWHTDLPLACQRVRANGLQLVGLHMHIGSGVDYAHLQEVCGAMVTLVQTAQAQGMDVQAISAGGGLSIPYQAMVSRPSMWRITSACGMRRASKLPACWATR